MAEKTLIESWEAKLASRTGDALERYEAARRIAGARSMRYIGVDEIAKLPMATIVEAIEAITFYWDEPDKMGAKSILGLVDKPQIIVSEALNIFLGGFRVQATRQEKNRRWRNHEKKGNPQLHHLTRGYSLR